MKKLLLSLLFLALITPIFSYGQEIINPFTFCEGGVCNYVSYRRFLEEDDQWKRLEEAKSLKGIYDVVFEEIDENYEIDVVDFNLTSIDLCFKSSIWNIAVPFEIYEEEYKDNDKIKKSKYKENHWFTNLLKKCYQFSVEDVRSVKFKLGENSTLLTLQHSPNNMDDTRIYQADPTDEYGSAIYTYIYYNATTTEGWILMRWNVSAIPSDATVVDGILKLYIAGDTFTTSEEGWVQSHELYSNYEVDGRPWIEGDCTSDSGCIADNYEANWNERPTSANYNLSYFDRVAIVDAQTGWLSINVTGILDNQLGYGNATLLLKLKQKTGLDGGEYFRFRSNEWTAGGTTLNPILNISYDNFTLYELNITTPLESNQLNTNSNTNETIGFDVFIDGVEQTTGVTDINVTIDGTLANILTSSSISQETSLYNYNIETNVVAYNCNSGSAPPPTSEGWACGASMSDITSNSGLDASDDSRTQSASSTYPFHVFNISIQESVVDIISITWIWEGDAFFDTARLYAWNETSGSAIVCGSGSSTSDFVNTCTFNSDVINNGVLTLWAIADDATSALIRTDFLNITVDFNEITTTNQFGYNGSEWVVNITTPTKADGTYDLFVNATIESNVVNNTEKQSVVYGTPVTDTCSPTSPLTADYVFDCSDECTQSTELDAAGYNIFLNEAGNFYIEANIINVKNITKDNNCNITKGNGNITKILN